VNRLTSPKLHELLADRFARDIVAERLATGEFLPPEPELAKIYDVSKSVVRTAIQHLAAAELVHIRHGKRTRVAPSAEWDVLNERVQTSLREEGRGDDLIRDLYQVRLVIEPEAAAWSARNATDGEKQAIQEIVERMKKASVAPDPVTAFLELDRTFHAAVAEASKNLVLCAVMRALHNVVTISWIRSSIGIDDLEPLLRQHAAIARAITLRSEAEAAKAMGRHLRWAAKRELAGNNGSVSRRSGRGTSA
jgi:DNA-binding FadR family transcriptional regulator